VKVVPSNQTLILAGERAPRSGPSGTLRDVPRETPGDARSATLERALGIGSSDAQLQRVTIVASRPDAGFVYLQADYSSGDTSASGTGSGAGTATATGTAIAAAPGPGTALVPLTKSNTPPASRGVGLYASTQRLLAETPIARRIDVHA
jgi:hypothetical protein